MIDKIAERRHEIAIYGLALVPLLAGISKFTNPGLWMGYEPAFIEAVIGLSSTQMVTVAGVIETGVGIWVATRLYSFYSTGLTFLWILAITVQVYRLGLWDIAIRDVGLTFYALVVFLNEYSRKQA